ncbi:hydroxyacylglutathione hydrolase [Strigomonas culicis]|uniref:Hydroxyacylglutathione hydrolase n=1 Tax=Strigomonas culicis TaxID=28005 RepID=S9UHP8_9TRYP|nr:hydroxyacylglutathione hydrolase [Strigomonas culicis]|eukprot:EPY28254.1 hydroxyacylglutathione hydrolase [Strigomonas culicis]
MPMFGDNYSYLLVHLQSRKAVAVDPADVEVLLYFLKKVSGHLTASGAEQGDGAPPCVELTEVLLTHKHWDHSGSNRKLMAHATSEANRQRHDGGAADCYVSPALRLYGSAIDAPMAATDLLRDFVNVASAGAGGPPPPLRLAGGSIAVDTFLAPGHTKGHVCYVVGDAAAYEGGAREAERCAVFTGDCLFSGGVGAFFELQSTKDVITVQRLFTETRDGRRGILLHPVTRHVMRPEDVYIYAGHEYTERLLTEIKSLMARQKAKPGAQSDEAAYASADAPAYLQHVSAALAEVARLRTASDGLAEANPRGSMRLPFCTMPSSLTLERRVNPLLTLCPAVLERLLAEEQRAGGLESATEIETAVYCSLNRQLC